MYASACFAALAWSAREAPAQEELIPAVARALGIATEIEVWMSVVLALAFIALFALTWLGLIWIPVRALVALRRRHERRRSAGRELEWLRFRLRVLKQENRVLREKLEEFDPAQIYTA